MGRRRFTTVSAPLLVALSTVVCAQSSPGLRRLVGSTFPAIVTSVVDGDTVDVKRNDGVTMRVRLEGIDCPERGEPFSTQARNATRVMLFDKHVTLKATDVDRYGRLVARITVEGKDSSLELVGVGLACHFTQYSSDRVLAAAQVRAKLAGRGFWAPGAQKPACVSRTATLPAVAATGPFHGNVQSHVYHAASCRQYICKSCTQVFQTEAEAQRAGFKPAGDCLR